MAEIVTHPTEGDTVSFNAHVLSVAFKNGFKELTGKVIGQVASKSKYVLYYVKIRWTCPVDKTEHISDIAFRKVNVRVGHIEKKS